MNVLRLMKDDPDFHDQLYNYCSNDYDDDNDGNDDDKNHHENHVLKNDENPDFRGPLTPNCSAEHFPT